MVKRKTTKINKKARIRTLHKMIKGKNYIRIKCNKCMKLRQIRTINEEIYTTEIRKKWICLFCRRERK